MRGPTCGQRAGPLAAAGGWVVPAMTEIDSRSLAGIAWLVEHARATAHPDRPWRAAGVRAVIDGLKARPMHEVALAALTAAITRPDQTSPAVIAMDGKHWAIPGQPPRPTGPPIVCSTCNSSESGHRRMVELEQQTDTTPHQWTPARGA